MTLALTTHIYGSHEYDDYYDTDSDNEFGYNAAMSKKNDYEIIEHTLANEKHQLGAQFVIAAKNNNLLEVQNLLNCCIDPNFQDTDGNTANHFITQHAIDAAKNKQSLNITEYASIKWSLYNAGATDDIPNNNGVTVKDINNGIDINTVKNTVLQPLSTKRNK